MMKKIFLFIILFCAVGLAQEQSILGMFKYDLVKTAVVSQDLSSDNTINWDNGSWFRDTITTTTEVGFSNAVEGQWVTLEIWTEGTTDALTFSTTIDWIGTDPNTYLTQGVNLFQVAKSGGLYLGIVVQ